MTKKSGSIILGCIALGVVVFYGAILAIGHRDYDRSSNAGGLSHTTPVQFVPTWTYRDSVDQMRGTTAHLAYIESNDEYENSIGEDAQRTKLSIRSRGKELNVFISNKNLQFTCDTYTGTYVSVKFDDGPVSKYQCTDSSDNEYGVAFISSEKLFVNNIKKAKQVIIETPVYQRGHIQQTFAVAGLNWESFNR